MAEIKKELQGIFSVCDKCGYTVGFHVSFFREEEGVVIKLHCPNCKQVYDIGWKMGITS